MIIHGPKLSWRDARADIIAKRVDAALESVAQDVGVWYRSYDDIGLARGLWAEHVTTALLPLVAAAYDDSTDITWRQLNHVDDPALTVTAALIPKFARYLTNDLIAGAKRRLTAIGDLLWDTMRAGVTAGLQLGESVSQLRERIRGTALAVAPRARNIASTEIISAVNAATFNQVKAAKVVALKRWVTEEDGRVRPAHSAVNGQQIAADAKFIVGGFAMNYPGDPEAPIEQTANCRCDLEWEIVEEKQLTEELVVQSLAADAFHLPGKHDQKNHGRRKSTSSADTSAKSTAPDVKVMPTDAEGAIFALGDEPWVFERDPDKRAVGLWASSFNGMDAIRQVMRNRAAGRADFHDFTLSSRRFNDTVLQMPEYSEHDLKDDVLAAAINFRNRLNDAPTAGGRLYRGMRFSTDSIPKPGDTFTQDVASWTDDKGWANVYANADDEYHRGDVAVIMRLEGQHRSVNINDDLPTFMRGSGEHIAGGTYRVKSITGRGKKRTIVVEEVSGEVARVGSTASGV